MPPVAMTTLMWINDLTFCGLALGGQKRAGDFPQQPFHQASGFTIVAIWEATHHGGFTTRCSASLLQLAHARARD